jgi:hypothetical protein
MRAWPRSLPRASPAVGPTVRQQRQPKPKSPIQPPRNGSWETSVSNLGKLFGPKPAEPLAITLDSCARLGERGRSRLLNKFQKDGGGANRDTRQYQTSKGKCAHSKILTFVFSTSCDPRAAAMDKKSCSGRERKRVRLDVDEGPSKRTDRSIETSEFGRFKISEKASEP